MNAKKLVKNLAMLVPLTLGAGATHAVPIFVGSYDVFSGPLWTTNPPVYSALEAAELVFGAPIGGVYEISVAGIDPNSITNTGWYDEIGIGPSIFAEAFSRDLGTPGYNGGGWVSGDDVSAYVQDNCGVGNCVNYVFFTATAPEPATIALMGLGLAGIGYQRRRKVSS